MYEITDMKSGELVGRMIDYGNAVKLARAIAAHDKVSLAIDYENFSSERSPVSIVDSLGNVWPRL